MTNIPAGTDRRRVQGGGAQFTTVATAPTTAYVSMGAYADPAGNQHFTLGACLSREGNLFKPVLDLDLIAGVVKLNNVVLTVP